MIQTKDLLIWRRVFYPCATCHRCLRDQSSFLLRVDQILPDVFDENDQNDSEEEEDEKPIHLLTE